MTTVAQLIEQLKQYPDDAVIEVMRENGKSYCLHTEYAPMDDMTVLSYTSPEDKKYPNMYGKTIIRLES